jgi:hypothetical protein
MLETKEYKKLKLIATSKDFHVAPFFIAPKFDEQRKALNTGQVWDTDPEKAKKQKENAAIVVTEEDSFMIKHLMEFNLENEVDRTIFEIIKLHDDIIASSKDKVIPGQHRYYIENKEAEAQSEISKVNIMIEAMNMIKDMSTEQMEDFGRVCQIRVRDLTKTQIEGELLKVAQRDPALVVRMGKDKNLKQRIFLKKLMENGKIYLSNGVFKYGDEVIGTSETHAVDWFNDPKNSKLVTELAKFLKQ